MIHNLLICHDLLKQYDRKTTPRCLVKVDVKKAYNMLNWKFLEESANEEHLVLLFLNISCDPLCISNDLVWVELN